MKRVCVLLNGAIKNDSRVIKVINTLSKSSFVDLIYVDGINTDCNIFNKQVKLYSCDRPKSIIHNIIRHTLFYNEFNFLTNAALKTANVYDIVYCNDLPTLNAGIKLKKIYKSKLVYDSHEIFLATLNQFYSDKLNIFKKNIMRIIIFFMKFFGSLFEHKAVKKVDYFITTSISFKNYFEKKYRVKNIIIVMNCPVLTRSSKAIDYTKVLDLKNDDFLVVFQGVLNKGRALDILIDSMKYVDEGIKLIMVGDGMLLNELKDNAINQKLKNIFFIGRVEQSKLLEYTRGANVGINLQESINISKHLASANKLFEYAHAGIPIIASDVPENRLIIEEFNHGVLVQNKPKEIAKAINEMAVSNLSNYKINSSKAARKYYWENQEKQLLKILN